MAAVRGYPSQSNEEDGMIAMKRDKRALKKDITIRKHWVYYQSLSYIPNSKSPSIATVNSKPTNWERTYIPIEKKTISLTNNFILISFCYWEIISSSILLNLLNRTLSSIPQFPTLPHLFDNYL